MSQSEQIRNDAGTAMDAAISCLQSGKQRIGYTSVPPRATHCLGIGLLACLAFTVSAPLATVVTVPTVTAPSTTVRYWVSTARGNRSRIHLTSCRYHGIQSETAGAAKRQYYPTIDAVTEAHPECSRCRVCLGVPE